jgi:hypothetical protein
VSVSRTAARKTSICIERNITPNTIELREKIMLSVVIVYAPIGM